MADYYTDVEISADGTGTGITAGRILLKSETVGESVFSATNFAKAVSTWTPTLSCSGSMTATAASSVASAYCKIGPWIFYQLDFTTTLGGTPSYAVVFSLPVNAAATTPLAVGYAAGHTDSSPYVGRCLLASASTIGIYKNDSSNWTAGARTFYIMGFYRWA